MVEVDIEEKANPQPVEAVLNYTGGPPFLRLGLISSCYATKLQAFSDLRDPCRRGTGLKVPG